MLFISACHVILVYQNYEIFFLTHCTKVTPKYILVFRDDDIVICNSTGPIYSMQNAQQWLVANRAIRFIDLHCLRMVTKVVLSDSRHGVKVMVALRLFAGFEIEITDPLSILVYNVHTTVYPHFLCSRDICVRRAKTS
jgi:hypothetical protein